MVMGKAEYWALQNAKTYWVSRRMVQTIEMAFNDLPDEPLDPLDIPTESGFAYFERPYYTTDKNGKTVNVRAICWRPQYTDIRIGESQTAMVQSMGITYYSDTRDPHDEGWGHDERFGTPQQRYKAGVPPLVLLATTSLPWRTVFPTGETGVVALEGANEEEEARGGVSLAVRVGTIGEPYDFSDGSFPQFPINNPDARLDHVLGRHRRQVPGGAVALLHAEGRPHRPP